MTNPEKLVTDTLDSLKQGYYDAKDTTKVIVKETAETAEKTGNLVSTGHYTTDDKVQYFLNMDDYEAKKSEGVEMSSLDTLVYYKSKSAAGLELTAADKSDLGINAGVVIDDATDAILQNIKNNIQTSTREELLRDLAVLSAFDTEDSIVAKNYLAGLREQEAKRQEGEFKVMSALLDSGEENKINKLYYNDGEVKYLVNCHENPQYDKNQESRYIYIKGGGDLNFVTGAAGIVYGAEAGVIIDNKSGDYKYTSFEKSSTDAIGGDVSPSGSISMMVANGGDYKDINDAYEGLKGGGYNVNVGLLGYSQNEDGKWKGITINIPGKPSVNINYSNTSVIKEFQTHIIKDE